MRILALDIGSGTEDVLLYDDSRELENCVKMVLPSPSLLYSKKVRYLTKLKSDIFIRGQTIGGGRFVEALKRHLSKGFRVFMTERVAYSVRNNLDEVRAQGFRIVPTEDEPSDFEGEILEVEEVNLGRLRTFLDYFEEDISDVAVSAVAVQDHGAAQSNVSNRRFRIDEMRRRLTDHPELESLAYRSDEIPNHFIRMNAAISASRSQLPEAEPVVMDTSIAAILGCLEDPNVKNVRTVMTANIGNEHVTASIISKRRVLALLEHHTSLLTAPKLESTIRNFVKGKVRDDVVFAEGGHGAFYLQEAARLPRIDLLVVTGPHRARLKGTRLTTCFAAPGGDMMMTGPMGLVKASRFKVK